MHTPHIVPLLRRSDAVVAASMVIIGAIHTGMTPVFKPQGGEDALWFAGSGLALCGAGALNLLRCEQNASLRTRWFCRSANLIITIHMLLVARALRAPHGYVVLALVSLATAQSFIPTNEAATEHG